MSIPFRYVRRKDNPAKYLMAGFSDFTGQFDTAEFEMVEGELPPDAEREVPADLRTDLRSLFTGSAVAVRAEFYPHQAAIESALTLGDQDGAIAFLQSLTGLSADADALRQDLLTRLQQ